jgi:hypothetical protein
MTIWKLYTNLKCKWCDSAVYVEYMPLKEEKKLYTYICINPFCIDHQNEIPRNGNFQHLRFEKV